jgi:anti-sigma factor RsiW
MAPWRRRTACDRAALWISLELDGEISELERAALAAHLGGCAECASARTEIAGFTRLMREAPLVAPCVEGTALALLPPRAQRIRRATVFALAAAIATSVAFLGLMKPPAAVPPLGLASATLAQRLQYASAEHARIDPRLPASALLRPAQPVVAPEIRNLSF